MTAEENKKIKHTILSSQDWTNIYITKYNTMSESMVELGRLALKVCLVMNGASALAILAFIGRIWSSVQNTEVIGILNSSLYWFSLGVLFILIAIILSYLVEFVNITRLETGCPLVEITEEENIELSSKLTGLAIKTNWYFLAIVVSVFFSALFYVIALNEFVDATTKYVS